MNRFWCCSRHFCCGWRVSKIISTVPMSFRNSHWESTTTLSAIALNCWNILSRYLRRNAFSSGTEIAHGPVPLSSLCSGVSSSLSETTYGAPPTHCFSLWVCSLSLCLPRLSHKTAGQRLADTRAYSLCWPAYQTSGDQRSQVSLGLWTSQLQCVHHKG